MLSRKSTKITLILSMENKKVHDIMNAVASYLTS